MDHAPLAFRGAENVFDDLLAGAVTDPPAGPSCLFRPSDPGWSGRVDRGLFLVGSESGKAGVALSKYVIKPV